MGNTAENGAMAQIDFPCFEESCGGVVKFDLGDVLQGDFEAVCPKCGRKYPLDAALRDAEDILGDTNVSVNVAGGAVKIPYALLLTRLNTLFTLDYGDRKVDFHLWVAPTTPETFR
ncbi:MAG: hypothetical protein J6S73_02900 [Lentisphaeria bacterium]|nr:hypothetical protein [Lentisphaeria bacterium]